MINVQFVMQLYSLYKPNLTQKMNILLFITVLLLSGHINCDHFVDPELLNVPEIKRMESEISQSYLLKPNFNKSA